MLLKNKTHLSTLACPLYLWAPSNILTLWTLLQKLRFCYSLPVPSTCNSTIVISSYTHISNLLEYLVTMNIVDSYNGVQRSIANGVVSITNMSCHFFQGFPWSWLAYVHAIRFNQTSKLFQALWRKKMTQADSKLKLLRNNPLTSVLFENEHSLYRRVNHNAQFINRMIVLALCVDRCTPSGWFMR